MTDMTERPEDALRRIAGEQVKVLEQATRYMVAVYGESWIFMAPETFDNALIRWIWGIASHEFDFADEQMTSIEAMVRADREAQKR